MCWRCSRSCRATELRRSLLGGEGGAGFAFTGSSSSSSSASAEADEKRRADEADLDESAGEAPAGGGPSFLRAYRQTTRGAVTPAPPT